jgi:hypothetical protein
MDTKVINLEQVSTSKKVKIEKEKKKRMISKTNEWINVNDTISQVEYIADISNINCLIKGQIESKIRGYKSQDNLKKKFCGDEFIDYDFVIEMLKKCDLKCFYCKKEVLLLYENVREPRQWSVERIDNDIGHNKGNVEIACLNCNLRRRTMYFERYIMTKQIQITKSI